MADLSVRLFGKKLAKPRDERLGHARLRERDRAPLACRHARGLRVERPLRRPHHGNPPPRLWEEKSALINSVGLQNIGLKRFFDEVFPLFRERETPVIINFFGFTEEEYVRCAEGIHGRPADRGAGDEPLLPQYQAGRHVPGQAGRRTSSGS